MIGKTSYSLQCSGRLEASRFVELLSLFHGAQINIRKLALLPALQDTDHARLDLLFELADHQLTFIETLQGFLKTLPEKDHHYSLDPAVCEFV